MAKRKSIYQVAAYCRLSRDDGDQTESDSIANQRRIIEDYCGQSPDLEIAGAYVDDGFTGTSFDRPGFKRMLADIEADKIDCVVVKDLSRFGRDYIDMGFYLERFFPEKGVRFIAFGERIDSAKGPYDMMMPLRNVINAQYAKDTSDKVRKSFHAKQMRGEFVGAFAPYGYVKDPANKAHFLVDAEAAIVVHRIFTLSADGVSNGEIARILNREGVPSPIEYKRLHDCRLQIGGQVLKKCFWSREAVKRILNNEVYLGNMISNRYPSNGMHGKTRLAPRSEWIVVEGTHEPVVARDLWERVQERLGGNKHQALSEREKSLFGGLVRCGDCGRALTAKKGRPNFYCCTAYKNYGAAACSSHYISERVLTDIVREDLNRVVARAADMERIAQLSASTIPAGVSPDEMDQKELRSAVGRIRRLKRSAYEAYRANILSREEFFRCKTAYDAQESALMERLAESAAGTRRPRPAQDPWTGKLAALGRLSELDRKTVEHTVKAIRVFEKKRIEITYLFSEDALQA